MPSLRSRLFIMVLRYKHLFRLQWKRKAFLDENTHLPGLRKEIEKGAGFFGKLPKGFEMEEIDVQGMHAEWIIPPNANKNKAILYFHGGGYAIGSCLAHRGITAKFVQGSGIRALQFDYRLAPEHPFPAALDDSVSAYRCLLDQKLEARNIVFAGDSAGGGLCLATLLALKEQSLPLPAGTIALSPWTDVTNSGESWKTNAHVDSLTWKESQILFSRFYAGRRNPADPLISPLFGDLTDLPPLLIFVGGHEMMLSDSTRFAKKARNAGVDVTLRIGEGLFHCYPACSPLFPEARLAMAEISDFIRKCLFN